MKAKIASGIMLTLLLVSVLDSVAVSFVLSAGSSEGGSSDWWSMFRHYGNHTGYSTGLAPTESITQVVWHNATRGSVYSSPAVVNDTVFVGSNDGRLYAFDLNGTEKYYVNVSLGNAIYSSPAVDGDQLFVGSTSGNVYAINLTDRSAKTLVQTNAPVYSSPVVDHGNVYVGSDSGYLYCINEATGAYTTAGNFSYGIRSSPAIADGKIFFVVDNGVVYALDATTLVVRPPIWTFDIGGNSSIDTPLWSSPSVADGTVFVGSLNGTVYAINAADGTEKWSNSTGGPVYSSPAVAYGKVFIGSNNGKVYAFNESNGLLIWNSTTEDAVCSSPAVVNSTVFVGSMDDQVYALDEANGSVRWKCKTGGGVWSSPAVADNKVFVGSLDNYVYAFEEPPTAIITHSPDNPIVCQTVAFSASNSLEPDPYGNITTWSWNFGDQNSGDQNSSNFENATHVYTAAGNYTVTLTVSDNRTASNSTSQLITVSEAWPMFHHAPEHWGNSTSLAPVTNQTLWSQIIGPISRSSPAVINSRVFIGSTNGYFYALDATNGNVIWSINLGDPVYSSPAVVDNTVFIAEENSTISAWDVNGARARWLWSNHTNNRIYSSPTVSGNRVLIGSGPNLYAFDKTSGNLLWTTRSLEGEVDSSPAVANGMVFVGSWIGKIFKINETNGIIMNESLIGNQIHIESSPTIAYGKVIVGAKDMGNIYAFNMNLELQWKKPAGGIIDSSPAVADGMVFVGSNDGVYAFNATNGEEIWNNKNCSVGYSSPAVAEGKVFIGTTDGKVLALRETDGELWWSYKTNGKVDSSPAVLNDTLYLGSNDGKIYAFKGQVHDVAITDVNATSIVAQNRTVAINVTLWNKGSYDETSVAVTASNDSTVFNTTPLNITRGKEFPLQIQWNTTNVPFGNHTICINAPLAPPETDYYTADNTMYVNITVQKGVHELGINDVESSTPGIDPAKPIPFRSIVGLGYNATIYVNATNEGDYDETNLNVSVYFNNTSNNAVIGGTTILDLLAHGSNLTSINCTTADLSYRDYTIIACVEPILGENNTTNNNCTMRGLITVSIPGDLDGDGNVKLADLVLLANAYGTQAGHDPPGTGLHQWNPNADIDDNGKVDLHDLVILASNYHP